MSARRGSSQQPAARLLIHHALKVTRRRNDEEKNSSKETERRRLNPWRVHLNVNGLENSNFSHARGHFAPNRCLWSQLPTEIGQKARACAPIWCVRVGGRRDCDLWMLRCAVTRVARIQSRRLDRR